jgi:hypothetical protein
MRRRGRYTRPLPTVLRASMVAIDSLLVEQLLLAGRKRPAAAHRVRRRQQDEPAERNTDEHEMACSPAHQMFEL